MTLTVIPDLHGFGDYLASQPNRADPKENRAMPTTPQDHQKPAAQREAEKPETATVTFGDLTFTIPATLDDLDGEFLKYAADEDAYRMVETVLSGPQFAKFKATGPKVRDYRAVGDQIAQVYGFGDAGE